jgi:hypothetical protein
MVEKELKVFRLGDSFSNTAFRATVEDVSEIWAAQRGNCVASPIVVRYASGKALEDFVWTDAATPLVSARVITALAESAISGWSTFPVKLFDSGKREISGYTGLAVTGRCGWIGFDRREESLIYRPNRSGGETRYFKGLKFDEQSWDGTDLFMDAEARTGWVLATERVRKTFRAREVTNVEFTLIDDVELIAQRSDIIPAKTP